MKRKIYDKLLEWKRVSNGKTAVILDGARRVGKSWIAEEFARNEYEAYLLIDFAKVSSKVKRYFNEYLEDLDTFFMYLLSAYNVELPKGKSVTDVIDAMSAQEWAEFEAKILCELADGGKTYQVIDYCTSPACAVSVNWAFAPTQNATVYAKWAKCITLVEITVEPPVCGTATETGKDSQGHWDFGTQTNRPAASGMQTRL